MIGIREESEESFRARIKTFSDEKLISVGKACAWKSPYPSRGPSDDRVEERRGMQLQWCRDEWRARHPKPLTQNTETTEP
jgi:hypothetical protein